MKLLRMLWLLPLLIPISYAAFLLFIAYDYLDKFNTGIEPFGNNINRIFHVGLGLLVGTLTLVYQTVLAIHALNVSKLSGNRTFLWITAIYLLNILAIPVYWALYVWQDPGKPQRA
jgi:hypothetical protein